MSIRNATQADMPELLKLGKAMHEESRWSALPFAEEKVRDLLVGLTVVPHGFLMVAEQGGQIIGVYAGWCGEHFFTHQKVASDFAVFVTPGKRGGLAAMQLIGAFIYWAKGQGAAIIQTGVSTGVLVEETTSLYERMGFETIGPIMELREH